MSAIKPCIVLCFFLKPNAIKQAGLALRGGSDYLNDDYLNDDYLNYEFKNQTAENFN